MDMSMPKLSQTGSAGTKPLPPTAPLPRTSRSISQGRHPEDGRRLRAQRGRGKGGGDPEALSEPLKRQLHKRDICSDSHTLSHSLLRAWLMSTEDALATRWEGEEEEGTKGNRSGEVIGDEDHQQFLSLTDLGFPSKLAGKPESKDSDGGSRSWH